MKSIQNAIRSIPGFMHRESVAIPLDHIQSIRIAKSGQSPGGLCAVSLKFQERRGVVLLDGPEMLFEIGDLAWYPYEYREPDLLFPFCVYRKEKGKLRVDHSLKRRLILMAEAWDQELLQYHLTA